MKAKETKKTEQTADGIVWWNVEQAAEYMGVTALTICRWGSTKGFPVHRISTKVVLYNRAEIDAWVQSKK